MTLDFKIRQYMGFLDTKIEEEEKHLREDLSIHGSVVAEQKKSAYLVSKEEFYKLFPEIFGEYKKPLV